MQNSASDQHTLLMLLKLDHKFAELKEDSLMGKIYNITKEVLLNDKKLTK